MVSKTTSVLKPDVYLFLFFIKTSLLKIYKLTCCPNIGDYYSWEILKKVNNKIVKVKEGLK